MSGCSSSYTGDTLKSHSGSPAEQLPVKSLAATPAANPQSSPAPQAPAAAQKPVKRHDVKGIYVSAWSAVGRKLDQLIQLVETTDLNAMVIDIKNDSGQITYASAVPQVNQIGANSNRVIPDVKGLLQRLKSKNIYTIARVVVFKDPYLGGKRSDLAMRSKTGKVWRDKKGVAWVDPFKSEVWDYNIAIAKEAAALGFDEIQFDYVRFPENGKRLDQEVKFDNPQQWSKSQAIEGFLKKAKDQVGSVAYLSADVFGLTTSSNDDMGIGQEWLKMSKEIDFISPMLYPSHYASGVYGVKSPDLQPYAIIRKAVMDGKAKNDQLGQASVRAADIRPWLQDFTATWIKPHKKYGTADVREQIKAAREQGVDQFLLWNSTSTYTYQ
ncbi:putative glycoside hydrolase [Paenibacillus athensensis]|uniref:putative glycoside hydrolase n=1 Tax=Paenibacillus athensensis TaxID=1967502 RepID=UPI001E34FBCD|nr:putative glycoside hydrolase [Paenibacillus athensensis]